MLDKKAYSLLSAFYKKGKLSFDEIREKTNVDETKDRSQYISALCSEHFIASWESSESINDVGDHKQFGYEITYAGRAYVDQRRRDGLSAISRSRKSASRSRSRSAIRRFSSFLVTNMLALLNHSQKFFLLFGRKF